LSLLSDRTDTSGFLDRPKDDLELLDETDTRDDFDDFVESESLDELSESEELEEDEESSAFDPDFNDDAVDAEDTLLDELDEEDEESESDPLSGSSSLGGLTSSSFSGTWADCILVIAIWVEPSLYVGTGALKLDFLINSSSELSSLAIFLGFLNSTSDSEDEPDSEELSSLPFPLLSSDSDFDDAELRELLEVAELIELTDDFELSESLSLIVC